EGKQFLAQSGSGHEVVIDSKDGDTGPTPVELVLLGSGGCTAFDVISILRKQRQQVTGYEVEVSAEQQEEYPKIFTKIKIHHILRGHVAPEALERAIRLSETKYCSVNAMLSRSASIDVSYEIVPECVPEPATASVG
ncbi:MAG TPA: OsmC family protein, partial [Terriglobia bacterium]|nr:OsmC family protein [Terriglobia bacterium]